VAAPARGALLAGVSGSLIYAARRASGRCDASLPPISIIRCPSSTGSEKLSAVSMSSFSPAITWTSPPSLTFEPSALSSKTCSGNHDLDARNESGEKVSRWILNARRYGAPCDGDRYLFANSLFTICSWWDGPTVRNRIDSLPAEDAKKGVEP